MDVLPWPSKSPDISPIENIWVNLSRMFYGHGKQYGEVQALEEAIIDSWDRITPSIVQKHLLSMSKRCLVVVKADGSKIFY